MADRRRLINAIVSFSQLAGGIQHAWTCLVWDVISLEYHILQLLNIATTEFLTRSASDNLSFLKTCILVALARERNDVWPPRILPAWMVIPYILLLPSLFGLN